MSVLVTGGAGFIGSHITDQLIGVGCSVTVFDNLKTGKIANNNLVISNKNFNFKKGDLLDMDSIQEAMKGVDTVYHMAANADVRGGIKDTTIDIKQGILATHNLLEAMRGNKVKKLVYASSAVVYGEPTSFPTTEGYCPIQTSLYGASKYSCEALIQAYCEYFDMNASIFRFASVIGPRYPHGVILDIFEKIKRNKSEIEILGDGSQRKSYVHVKDLIRAIEIGTSKSTKKVDIFNIGNKETIFVREVVDLICQEMEVPRIKRKYSGGQRGWVGDSPQVELSTEKLRGLGWTESKSTRNSIKETVDYLKETK